MKSAEYAISADSAGEYIADIAEMKKEGVKPSFIRYHSDSVL